MGDSPDIAVVGNAVTMGVVRAEGDVLDTCIHGASVKLPALTGADTRYRVTFAYNLFTWDAYNASTVPGNTGFWDSFSVSVSKQPYADLMSLSDPITAGQASGDLTGVGFLWGGNLFADGVLDCNPNGTCPGIPATTTVDIPGNTAGDSYLNVVLDTITQPEAKHNYPSYGTITILDIVSAP